MEEATPQIFQQLTLTLVPADDSQGVEDDSLIDLIVGLGGQVRTYEQYANGDTIHDYDYIISSHIDFERYQETIDAGISVVTPQWILDSITKRRLTVARQYNPDPEQFFRAVIVSSGTLAEPDEDALRAGVHALGGQWSDVLTRIVTHIVSTNLEHEKCIIARERELSVKIVLPQWFDDCLRLGKKIDERPYELPDPEILRSSHDRPIAIHEPKSIRGATASQPALSAPPSPSKSRKELGVFRSKKVFLNDDLQLSLHLDASLSELVKMAGGQVTSNLEEADIYVGKYRLGDNFVDAFLAKKTVGNLAWLYHVLNRNCWTDPKRKLLHYPVPGHALSGFEDFTISISNYTGDARIYLQNLVQECGAAFTKSMKQDNTHLVTANKSSEKCEAAQEWNINMINHIWLEESYARCAVQPLDVPRYTHFPSRTNLGEVCGQTPIDLERVERMFVLPVLQRRIAAQEQIPTSDTIEQPELVMQDSQEVTSADSLKERILQPAQSKVNRRLTKSMGAEPDAPSSSLFDHDKENQVPRSTGRTSKIKALGALHQQADDIALFQKEMKRKGGVVHGGRPERDATKSKKRSSTGAFTEGDVEMPDVPGKKAKISEEPLPPVQYHMMITGDTRWEGHPQQESQDKQKLRQLGIVLTSDPKSVDILVAKSIIRTRKFVSAIAQAPKIVGVDYLDSALSGDLPEEPALLSDTKMEREYDFKLAEAIERAENNKGCLFKGWGIYLSDNLSGGFDTFRDIVKAHGGEALAFRGSRRGTTLRKRQLDPDASTPEGSQTGEEESDNVYFIATNSAADKALAKQFRVMAREQNLKPRVATVDWLLVSALTQLTRWNPKWELVEASR